MGVGELFILGFRGKVIPSWLLDFEKQFGLGGVILFDYNCQTKTYDNNVESPEQVERLCREISSLTSRPLIFVDQEGGKVRRFKEKLGFAPLPSAFNINKLPENDRLEYLKKSFKEMKDIGIDFDLAPVVDLNFNPKNPDIGAVERSFSNDPTEVSTNVELVNKAAKEVNLGLCLKHYPGLGGATVNSHDSLTDISDSISETQLELFWKFGGSISGEAVLVSHGIVKQWDKEFPTSMSKNSLKNLRTKLPKVLLISDDIQMQGLQKIMSSHEACIRGLEAGIDMMCIGNNLMPEDGAIHSTAQKLKSLENQFLPSIKRVLLRKKMFKCN